PSYFVYDAVLNRKDRPLLDETAPLRVLDIDEATRLVDAGAMLLDGRTPEEFAHGHLVGSINVGLEGRYAEFAGSVVPSDDDIVLVVEPGFELEARNRLGRIGFDRVVGYLDNPMGVMAAAPERTQRASRLTVNEFEQRRVDIGGIQIVDIRNPGEVALGSVPGATAIPVGQLPGRVDELDPSAPTVVYCAGGYRSSVAASLLRLRGFDDVSDLVGGFGAWVEVTQTPAR
ncbi:MAG TPA: rhodanese-like domain-containing protein, partial [Ilumatobacteraceae bacterium]|nr:rhodanese-like domain-containing protein [Ilumatobacteraceae bacterium]